MVAETGERLFVIQWEPGDKWISGLHVTHQDLADHRAYWGMLSESGSVKVAGPYLDVEAGGLAVFAAATLKEAEAVMSADPAIQKQIFIAHLRPLYVVFPAASRGEG